MRTLIFIILLIAVFPLQAEQLTLKSLVQDKTFVPKGIKKMQSVGHGDYTTVNDKGEILLKKYEDTDFSEVLLKQLIVEGDTLEITAYELSEDRTKLLVATNVEPIYRHSFKADYFIIDLDNKKQKPQKIEGKVQQAVFSPDASKVAYVRDNNLYYFSLKDKKEYAVTTDGVFRKIINGLPDWVYEEEFAFSRAFEWSPDGKQLAYMKFDEEDVPVYTLYFYDNDESYPRPFSYKYPKAGAENATVGVWVYGLESQKNIEIAINKNKEQYIPRIRWTKNNGELLILRLNRHQNQLDYLVADTHSGKVEDVYTQKNKCFVESANFDAITFLDTTSFALLTEQSGFNGLYRFNYKTKKLTAWLVKPWDITKFYGIDKGENAYCQATIKYPYNRELIKVTPKGSYSVISEKEGWNTARFDKDFNFLIQAYSTAKTPTVYTVRNLQNKKQYLLQENKKLVDTLELLKIPQKEFVKLPSAESGTMLSAWCLKPIDFQEDKQYPVLLTQYSGPNSQQVKNTFSMGWEVYLAQQGHIVYCVDTRGTAARGEAFRKATYLQLGKLESKDLVAVGKYLQSLPYVAKNNITLWGWSYGGFMSALTLMKGQDVFNAAISVAPVTHWKFYDSVYTERYMRTPKENANGYNENSPLESAELLKDSDAKLLLVHGTADDNVHVQNLHALTAKLVAMDFPFQQYVYADKNHSIYGKNTRLHLYKRFMKFLKEVNSHQEKMKK